MNYLVVARKYRPMTFSDVMGQEHISQTLQNAIRMNRIAQGYIFSGSRGVGKTTTARVLAKSLNCEKIIKDNSFREKAEPCNECESCQDFDHNRSLNIFEFDAASNNSVEDVRNLRENVRYGPQKGKYCVYIIDEFHMLSTAAFNAFLKTLEEPPPHAVFIFATTELHKVPLTIASRCQKFIFKRIALEKIEENLLRICEKENVSIDKEAISLIAQKADGSMRDAQSLLDQIISFSLTQNEKIRYKNVAVLLDTIDYKHFFQVSDAVVSKNYEKILEVGKTVYENGYDTSYFITELIKHFHNFFICKTVKSSKLIEATESIKKQYEEKSESFSPEALSDILSSLADAEKDLRFFQESQLRLELALLMLIDVYKDSNEETRNTTSYNALNKRLIQLEAKLQELSEEQKKKL